MWLSSLSHGKIFHKSPMDEQPPENPQISSDHVTSSGHKLRLSSAADSELENPRFESQSFHTKKQIFEYFQSAFRDQRTILEAIADNAPAVIYVKDTEGRYLLVNRSFEILFHMDRKKAQGKNDFEIFPKIVAEAFMQNDRKVLQTGQPLEAEEEAPHEDGMHTYISLKFPIRDASGQIYAVAGISTDISERKKIELALQNSNHHLEKIINAVADPIFVKDRQHRWVLLNDALCRFMGYSRKKLLGKSDYDFFPKDQADVFWKKDEEVFLSGQENINEEYFTDAQGKLHTIVTKKSLYKDALGAEYIVGVIRDVTDQKEAEKNLLRKNLELAQANAEREYLELFAYVASHDLQEPLQKMIAFGGLLKTHSSQDLDEKGRSFVEKLQLAAMRMSRMIEDLLQFTKVTMSAEAYQHVELEVIVGEVLSDLDMKISQSAARIEVGNLPTIEADRRQMYLLFLNLIGNALKFQEKNSVPKISIQSIKAEPGYAKIEIRDNGIGFSEKFLEKIFQPFERGHHREAFEGSGMGLAICKKIVIRHGGWLTAHSEPGKGSIFVVSLPIKGNARE